MQNEYTHSPYQFGVGMAYPTPAQYVPPSPSQLQYDRAPAPSSLVQRRRPSGSRRMSPDDLIPLDAPTQPRRYAGNSTASRRSYSKHFDDEEDELTEEPPSTNATEQERTEWKRRQNTLAARRSRKRKLMQQVQLEQQVEQLTQEKEVWRTRALTLRQLLISHGILCPDFKD